MLRSVSQLLEFCIGGTGGVNEQFATKGKRIELVFEAQAFEFEGGTNRQEDVVALSSHRSSG